MTFSPDGSFPVVNIEKGRLPGHVTADFTPSEKLPRLLSVKGGTKINVVPGEATAVLEGLDDDLVRETGRQVTEETGVVFEIQGRNQTLEITAIGEGAHAAAPAAGKNALAALLLLLDRLPFAACEQMEKLHSLTELFPWNDTEGNALGIAMSDECSGALTVAFSLLDLTDRKLDASFDSRVPICGTDETVVEVIRTRLVSCGLVLENKTMTPPHYVDGDSPFVKTLLGAFEAYTGRKGYCEYTGGGTYVHDLKNGVAFGAAMPETDNRMHGADEFAVIDELVVSAKIFAQVIIDLCK